jgi:hypothetical protein
MAGRDMGRTRPVHRFLAHPPWGDEDPAPSEGREEYEPICIAVYGSAIGRLRLK